MISIVFKKPSGFLLNIACLKSSPVDQHIKRVRKCLCPTSPILLKYFSQCLPFALEMNPNSLVGNLNKNMKTGTVLHCLMEHRHTDPNAYFHSCSTLCFNIENKAMQEF